MEKEEDEKPDPAFVKGFNDGYLLAEHEPTLAAQIAQAQGNSPQLDGLKAGYERFQFEKGRAKSDPRPQSRDESEPTRDRDLEPDR